MAARHARALRQGRGGFSRTRGAQKQKRARAFRRPLSSSCARPLGDGGRRLTRAVPCSAAGRGRPTGRGRTTVHVCSGGGGRGGAEGAAVGPVGTRRRDCSGPRAGATDVEAARGPTARDGRASRRGAVGRAAPTFPSRPRAESHRARTPWAAYIAWPRWSAAPAHPTRAPVCRIDGCWKHNQNASRAAPNELAVGGTRERNPGGWWGVSDPAAGLPCGNATAAEWGYCTRPARDTPAPRRASAAVRPCDGAPAPRLAPPPRRSRHDGLPAARSRSAFAQGPTQRRHPQRVAGASVGELPR